MAAVEREGEGEVRVTCGGGEGGEEEKWKLECCSELADGSFVVLESCEERVKISAIKKDGMSGLIGSLDEEEMDANHFMNGSEMKKRVQVMRGALLRDESIQWKASIGTDNKFYLTIESAMITLSLQLKPIDCIPLECTLRRQLFLKDQIITLMTQEAKECEECKSKNEIIAALNEENKKLREKYENVLR